MVQPSPLDFEVRKFAFYEGPNYYLPTRAMVFNVYLDPTGWRAEHYLPHLTEHMPSLADREFDRMADLFVAVVKEALRLDVGLHVHQHSLHRDGDETVVAVEYLDDRTAQRCVLAVRDWFRAINAGQTFDWPATLHKLQRTFDRSPMGGPTIYSLIEAGLKRSIPVLHYETENCFQWGYGSRAIRGRSTVFHSDSVKDTEFTTFKDRVKEFLAELGFPVPQGKTCDTEEEIVEAAEAIGFPVVVKPVAGHKGQGVFTNLRTAGEVAAAFRRIHPDTEDDRAPGDGVIVESFIEGGDYRLMAVAGQFAAALHREPAHVIGDGTATIATLIDLENATPARRNTIRSPLGKIIIDQNMEDYLASQGLHLDSIPSAGQRVNLRKIANISAGGVSVNVTDQVHPANRLLVESVAGYFGVTCLGIDVIAADISRPWTEGQFGIIEINAGPGIFMHTAPAKGEPVDVPGMVMDAFFPNVHAARVPIIAGNRMSPALCEGLSERLRHLRPSLRIATLSDGGQPRLQGRAIAGTVSHRVALRTILRHPHTQAAVLSHNKDTLFDDGTIHHGADVVILREPHYAEEILSRDLLPGGILVTVADGHLLLHRDGVEVGRLLLDNSVDLDQAIPAALTPFLPAILDRYGL